METNNLLSQILLMSLMALAIGAQARPGVHFHPCRMFLISMSYSVSSPVKEFTTIQSLDSLPQLDIVFPSDFFLRRVGVVSSEFADVELPRAALQTNFLPTIREEELVVPARPAIAESARDRARDILSVVISLILGAGCGALVASTMYLVWSLINNSCDFDCGDDEEVAGHGGYVKIPAEAEPVKVKEGYEAN